ncbi:MAG: DUF2069 domain-containing protein [Burkholderiales bacterium]|nr:DUF2069 domain-containing protein [Burkholderiales bacterium]
MTAHRLHLISVYSLVALITLCLTWELWLAPLRPGGSWLVLKVLPLLAPLFGILRRKRYTYQWSSMLILAYFTEGVVRGYTEAGLAALIARVEIALSLLFFLSVVAYVRATDRERVAAATDKSAGKP